jgi:hypothetical protein
VELFADIRCKHIAGAQVEHDEVRLVAPGGGHACLGGGAFVDHHELFRLGKQVAYAIQDDRVVVDQQHPRG